MKNCITFVAITILCAILYVALVIKFRSHRPNSSSSHESEMGAIRKLAHGEDDPAKYTDKELMVLSYIAHDKYRRTDMSLVDVYTQKGLSRLSFALYHHQIGYKYYLNKLVFGEE